MSSQTSTSVGAVDQEEYLEIWRWVRLIWRAWPWVLAATLLGAVLGRAFALRSPASYRATARLVFSTPPSLRPDSPGSPLSDYLALLQSWGPATQAEALKSEGLALRALLTLPKEQRAFFPTAASQLRRRITVQAARGSDLILVQVGSPSREASVALANALVDDYIKQMEQASAGAAASARTTVEPELEQTQGLLREAEQRLAERRQLSGVYDPEQERQLAVRRLSELRDARSDAVAQLAATQAALAKAVKLVDSMPAAVESLQRLTRQPESLPSAQALAAVESRRAELEQTYRPDSPEVARARNREAAARELSEHPPIGETTVRENALNVVRQDVEKDVSGFQVQEAQLDQRIKELDRQIAAQAGHLDLISSEQVTQAPLLARVEALEAQHKVLAEQMEAFRLRAATSLPSATVLERASVQTVVSSRPRRTRVMLASAFLAFLAASVLSVASGSAPWKTRESVALAGHGGQGS